MGDRTLLGAAGVSDAWLEGIVRDRLADPAAALLSSRVDEVDYALPAITTGGRWWVSGTAASRGEVTPFRFFVKVVRCWSRSPEFVQVPEDLREMAAADVPWQTEAEVYRSDLADRLPAGLSMVPAYAVLDLDDLSRALWLDAVEPVDLAWDLPTFDAAAHLLGRMAASARVAPLRNVGHTAAGPRTYLRGRLRHAVLPMLRSRVWDHPLVAETFSPELRARLLAVADRVEQVVEELCSFPTHAAHGDACPNNLLGRPDGGFWLIDFGFWSPQPVGFDLAQLLVGGVQTGAIPADRLAEIEATIVPAYTQGLHAEGSSVTEDQVRRAHALQLVVFTGLSTLPFEHLESAITPALVADARGRASIAEHSLDLLDATG
ncbi:phosphotransferase [Nocardioides sp.]|uniref:phosphotransferase n=1 Tax=Nocardioides sp. TaxID=35761 RepID=UPI003528DBA7